mgnify:CR=1 FL=1|tara:strand:+ start:806 stop:946 length:141 start_codon:yes stop_codon:yes gene_type:complete
MLMKKVLTATAPFTDKNRLQLELLEKANMEIHNGKCHRFFGEDFQR